MEKGIKGFSATGIYPLNPDKFTSEDFVPANEFRELVVEDDPETLSRKEQPVNDLRIVPGPSDDSSDESDVSLQDICDDDEFNDDLNPKDQNNEVFFNMRREEGTMNFGIDVYSVVFGHMPIVVGGTVQRTINVIYV
ncbi:hypothetical protein J6590_056535 [Homalodisca vitripennis]|nr:hypothetical protein J6590_069342 [Homalodisca vitripennis]KAG8330709.1 hypothetical protein J6590_056535 [Homalodisca vitripennis]